MNGRYDLEHKVHEYREPTSSSADAAASSTPCMRGSRGVSDTSATAMLEGGSIVDVLDVADVLDVVGASRFVENDFDPIYEKYIFDHC